MTDALTDRSSPTDATKGAPVEEHRRWTLGLDRFSGLYLWVAFIVAFGIWVPQYFLTQATLHTIASSQAVPAIVAVAVLIPMAAGVFDLSVGATTNLCSILVVVLQAEHGVNMWVAMACGVLTGVVVGLISGFFVVVLHVDSFITTLGMSVVVAAVQEIVSHESQPPTVTSTSWADLTQHTVFGFQVILAYLIVIVLVGWWFLDHTPTGRRIYAVGGNIEAARLSGVAVDKLRWGSLVLSGLLCGVAGTLYASLNGPSLTFGAGMLLPAFAAVFLGSTQFTPGRVNIWGTVVAVYVLATGVQGLELVTGVQWLNDMFSGVALVGAVSFAVARQRSTRAGWMRIRRRRAATVAAERTPG